MTSEPAWHPRRLHSSAFLVSAYQAFAGMLVPIILATFLGGKSAGHGFAYALVGAIASAIYGVLKWQSTSYWIADGALHFRSGIAIADERTVPTARIAALDESQGPVQRLFGVHAIHVQTAGGGEHDIVLAAVTDDAAAELRHALGHVVEERTATEAAWRISRRGLVLAALTGPQFRFIAPAVAALYAVIERTGDDQAELLISQLPTTVTGWVMLVAALLVLALLLSLIGAVVAFSGFTVDRDAERLRIRRGLLSTRVASVTASRIHGLRIIEGSLPRWLGVCSVRIEVASYRDEPAAAQTLFPVCRRADLPELLARLLPELERPAGPAQRPPGRALTSCVLRAAVAWTGVAALAALAAREAGAPTEVWIAPAVAAAVGSMLGIVRFRALAWWLGEATIAVRSHRLLARTTTVALTHRLQESQLRQTLLQRRSHLAHAGFAIASGHRAAAAYLEDTDARALIGRLAQAARTTPG